jgi:hypothetical protein
MATRSGKFWLRAAITLTVLCALVFGARAVLRSEWMRGLVLEKLRTVVVNIGGPSYTLTMGKMDMDPVSGDVAIADILVEPDTSLFDSLRQGHGRFLLSTQAGRISITGLSYWRLLLKDEVRVASVTVNAPVIRYRYASHRDAHTSDTAVKPTAQGGMDRVSIGELVITEASGTALDLTGRAPELGIGRMDVRAREIRVLLPKFGAAAEWEVGEAQVEIDDVRAELPPLYDMSIAHVGLLHPEGLVTLDSLRYVPRVDRRTSRQHLREMTSIYAVDVKRISLARVDLYRAFAEQQVEVGVLAADSAILDIFLDKTLPDEPYHFKPLPVSALRNLPFGLSVDTLRLTNANMTYAERFTLEKGYGSMRLTDIGVALTNVSNDTLLALADTAMRGTVDAKLFGAGVLHAVYTAPLSSRNDAFTMDVALHDMPLSAANSMSENLILLKADSGWINSLKFRMSANNDSAVGPFTLKYSDAWLQIVKPDGGKRRFLTQLTNTAVHHDSKDRPVDERTMMLRIARKKDRSVFNYIWIYTREGLTHTLFPEVLADLQGAMMKQKDRGKQAEQKRDRKRAKKKRND